MWVFIYGILTCLFVFYLLWVMCSMIGFREWCCFELCVGRLFVFAVGLILMLFVCGCFVILLLKLLGLIAFWETLLCLVELFEVGAGLWFVIFRLCAVLCGGWFA